MLTAYLQGVGARGAGLPDWRTGAAILAQRMPPAEIGEPRAELLPANERRRASATVRWALDVAVQATEHAGLDVQTLATVFATSGGDYDVLDKICAGLSGPTREVSPTLFHHSVHNAVAGYWCIATGNQQSSTSVAAYDYTFAVGLLEALTFSAIEQQAVLLVAYDLPPAPRLYPARPLPTAFATALIISPQPQHGCQAELRGALELKTPAGKVSTLVDAALEGIRLGNPAARALPLLYALAVQQQATLRFEYSDDYWLRLDCTPCKA